MTRELKLVRTYDGTRDMDTLDLLDYAEGIDVAYEGWVPRVPTQDETEVIETLTLRVKGSSHNDLANTLQRIAQFSEYARWYRENQNERYGVWLRAKLDNESESRQTFVHNIDHSPAASIYSRAVNEISHLNSYIMQIRRVPYWEGTVEEQMRSEGDFTALDQTSRLWKGISVDASNQNVYACVYGGDIYKQTAGTGNFIALGQTSRTWTGVSIDSSNQNVYASVNGGDIYKQTAGTGNFVALGQTSRNWTGVAVDNSNQNVYACVQSDDIYKQTAGTGNFIGLSQEGRDWRAIAVDSSNQNVYAVVYYDDIYKQTAGDGNFLAVGAYYRNWQAITVDSSNQDVYAPEYGGDVYKTLPPISCGAMYTYTNIQGDVPARISHVGVDGLENFGIGRFWLGFRSTRFGLPALFQSWYAFADEPGAAGTASALALGGTAVITNYTSGTPDYIEITPSKHGVNISQQNGTYLVLARCFANTLTTSTRMRMYVTVGTSTAATSTRYYPWTPLVGGLSASGWGMRYYEMGVINIPVFGRLINGAVPDMTNLKIGLEIYRTSGIYQVHCDGLVLIPIAEGLVKSSLPSVPGTISTDMAQQQAIVTQTPEGVVSAYETDGTYITRVHDVSLTGGVPPGDGVIVFAADNMFGGSPDYKASLLIKRKTRWKELAGSEQ